MTSTDPGAGGPVTTVLRTCYAYDALGRRISETQPNADPASCPAAPPTAALPFTTSTRYDAAGRVTGTISPDPDTVGSGNPSIAVRNSYDLAGRLVKVETGTLAAWQGEGVVPAAWSGFTVHRTGETRYDIMSRKVREWLREGPTGPVRTLTEYSYDLAGRQTCTAVRMNPAAFAFTGTPNACAANAPGSEGPDRISRTVYDAAGQRLQLRVGVGSDVEGAAATWAYNLNGQITTLIDGNGNRAALIYDGHGRQNCWMFPSTTRPPNFIDSDQTSALASAGALSGGMTNGQCSSGDYEAYAYDPNGNRTTYRKRDNSTLTFTYDDLNRMTLKVVPERTGLDPSHTRDVHYGYDLRGLQLYARFDSASGEGVTNAWDGFGRPLSSSINLGATTRTLSYRHDRNGARTRLTHPDGAFFSMDRDGLGRTTWLTDPLGSGIAVLAYDALGAPVGIGRPGANTGYWVTGDGRLFTLTHYFAAGLDVLWVFAHNPAGQIAAVTRTNDDYAWQGHYAVNRPYTTDGLNRYTQAGNAQFGYDANGNLTSEPAPGGGTRTYTYDVENRLVAASGGLVLSYDPLGRLWRTSGGASGTTTYLYDGDALIAEYNGSGNLADRYVHGPNAAVDDPLVWYDGASTAAADRINLLADHQGSIIATSDNAANRLTINRYDEYGIPAAGNSGRFQYTGQIWLPDLGMYYYKARVLSPTLGRFLQTDPIGYEDQFNLYAYVGNDPVNLTDPDGESMQERNWISIDERDQVGQGAAVGVGSRGGYVGIRSDQVRRNYIRTTHGLNRVDPRRGPAKTDARVQTPREVRNFIERRRPSVDPAPGSGGTANRTNPRVDRAARTLGRLGRASAVGTAVTASHDIATSDNPVRAAFGNAGAIVGGIGGGAAGAAGGGAVGGPVGGVLGGVAGAAVGGETGYKGGTWIYDALFGD